VAQPEEMPRDELVVLARDQAKKLVAQDRQITVMAGQLSELEEAYQALADKLARLEHLLSRNSGNSSAAPSRDEDPGKPAPPTKKPRGGGKPARKRGKQPGAPGSHLPWSDAPDLRLDRFPTGRCDCGQELATARDLGVVDRYQQHEIPQVSATVTQYDQHRATRGRAWRVNSQIGGRRCRMRSS
jgi:transposase